jgi:general secretion pathway protein G
MPGCQTVVAGPRRARHPEGMTLLEIMVVLVIIGLVASVTAVSVFGVLVDAKIKITREAMGQAETGLMLYRLRHGRFPDTSQGLKIIVDEKIMPKLPQDGWGRELRYTLESGRYTLTSYAEDEAPGGTGAAEDISATFEQ